MSEVVSERLVGFLYTLARDELAMGAIEDLMWNHVSSEKDSYCNTYLEAWARDLAIRLTDDTVPVTDWKHMFKGATHEERFWVALDGTRERVPYNYVNKHKPGRQPE